jgi:PAS domain S-box-containing protein
MNEPTTSEEKASEWSHEELPAQLLAGIIESATDAIISTDLERRIVLFNPAAARMFQVSAEEAVGQPLEHFIPEFFDRAHRRNVEEPGSAGGSIRRVYAVGLVRGDRAKGREFPVEVSISQTEVEGKQIYTAILRDISERKQAEETLREVGQRLLLAIETAQLGTYERDLTTNEVRLNDVCRTILGLREGTLPADIAHRAVYPEDEERVMAAVARAYDPALREVCGADFRIVRPDGTVRWVAGRGRVIFDERALPARPLKFLGVLRDITERKLAETQLQSAKEELARSNVELEQRVQERTGELNEMITELEHMSYNMIHEMRAPLRAIHSYGGILEETQLREEAHQLVAKMRISARWMDQLLTGALNYNKAVRRPLPVGPTNVLQVLRDLLAAHPEFQPPHAEVLLEGEFMWVMGNEAGLAQCFGELVRNGVKFVEAGKKPRIKVWGEQVQHPGPDKVNGQSSHKASQRSGGEWARVCFQDNGIGIAEGAQGRIFDMFQRLHGQRYRGTGIGLALVRKVIEHMGGRVGVRSKHGKGSLFWLELPQASAGPHERNFHLAA